MVPIVELRVTDAEGRVLGPDEVGEIWFRGPNLIRGYWDKPEATAETIVDGWLRSGDIGRIDDEGFVYVQDRAKDMVLRAGENIYCAEVEAAIYEHPAVYEAAVYGLPHERLGEEVAVSIVTRPGASLEPEALRAFLAQRLAPFKHPDPLRAAQRAAPAQPGGQDHEARAARRADRAERSPLDWRRMILHEPELTRSDGRIRVQSRVETRHPKLAGLGRLWFEVDEASGLAVSDRADPFLVGMIPVAMACREAIEVRGAVSPRLAWGIGELQQIHFAWWPRHVGVVDVRCERLEEAPPQERGTGVATSFSGGVDSFYTTWRHTGERETIPGFRLGYALLIDGFDLDVDLEETGRWSVLRAVYAPLLATLGVELVIGAQQPPRLPPGGSRAERRDPLVRHRAGRLRARAEPRARPLLSGGGARVRPVPSGRLDSEHRSPSLDRRVPEHPRRRRRPDPVREGRRGRRLARGAREASRLLEPGLAEHRHGARRDRQLRPLPQVRLDADEPRADHGTHPLPELSPRADARESALGRAAQPAPRRRDPARSRRARPPRHRVRDPVRGRAAAARALASPDPRGPNARPGFLANQPAPAGD